MVEKSNEKNEVCINLFGLFIITIFVILIIIDAGFEEFRIPELGYVSLLILTVLTRLKDIKSVKGPGFEIVAHKRPPIPDPIPIEEIITPKDKDVIITDKVPAKYVGTPIEKFLKGAPIDEVKDAFQVLELLAMDYLFVKKNSEFIKEEEDEFQFYPEVKYDNKLTGMRYDGILRRHKKRIWIETKVFRKKIKKLTLLSIVSNIRYKFSRTIEMFTPKNELLLVIMTFDYGREYEESLRKEILNAWPINYPPFHLEFAHIEEIIDKY